MSDYNKSDIGSGYNTSSALNTELGKIETSVNSKVDKTGSTMSGDLDMNSNQILNLPAPVTDTEPLRKGDISSLQNIVVGYTAIDTAVDFIASSSSPSLNDIVEVQGYLTKGDGGKAAWRHNGVTNQTPSQSPAQLGDALMNDASGNQWEYVPIVGTLLPAVVAKALGLASDGATNDSPIIDAAKEFLKRNNGGAIILGAGDIAISTTIDIDSSNISLVGSGADRSHDIGGQGTLFATSLKWIGAASGTMVHVYSPTGGSNQKHIGCGVSKIYFNANSLAGVGLLITSQNSGNYEDLHFHEFSTACLKLTAHTLGEAADPQINEFKRITCRQFNQTGAFVELDGISTANASMNSFYDMSANFQNGDAFVLRNCDNNTFIRCRAVRAGGGSGNAIVAHGSNSAVGQVARSNLFLHFSTNAAGIVAKGTTTYTYASHDNRIIMADKDNSTPVPTLETGATFWFDTDENVNHKQGLIDCVMASTEAQIATARGNQGTETLRIKNDASNHVVIESGDGSSEWSVNIDNSTGDLRVSRTSGTGNVQLDQQLKLTNQSTGTTATAGGASALPANPQGYLRVTIGGTTRKIPFYQE